MITTTIVVKESDIGTPNVHAVVKVTNDTTTIMEIQDKVKGGSIVLNGVDQIQLLKQFILDAGY